MSVLPRHRTGSTAAAPAPRIKGKALRSASTSNRCPLPSRAEIPEGDPSPIFPEPMNTLETKTSVEVVDSNGQISLGKEYAGRQVLVEQREPGVWLVRTAQVVPENESWLHEPKVNEDLQRALQWTQRNPPKESDPDAILRKLEHGGRSKQKPRPAGPR